MRGHCQECRTLRRIRPLALELGSRQCSYGPVEHDVPDRHVECGGVVEYEERHLYSGDPEVASGGDYFVARCAQCGVLPDDADVARSHERCAGSNKPIR